MSRIREAIELCLEDEQEMDSRGKFIGIQRITVNT
jgi:hypothetical protein